MTQLAFAARVLYEPGEVKPDAPERVLNPLHKYVVRNPFTGHKLWLRPTHIVNVVNGVATVQLDAQPSGRWYPVRHRHREFINPLTGNTFLVDTRAIIKETA